MSDRILITGATGCIGSACVSWLRQAGFDDIVSLARSKSAKAEQTEQVTGDISDVIAVRNIVDSVKPSRIIHLAGLQTPDCQAYPFAGMAVNVEGTHHLWRAAAELGNNLKRIVFASSAAVYGPRSMYEGSTVLESDGLRPPNLYGHWKVAGEGATQAFHLETGVPAISLRLATTYGPGRDRGLTSAPTSAMKALARGERFEMTYEGREHYHYVADVGAAFGICAVRDFDGYETFNLRGTSMATRDFIGLVRQVAEDEQLSGGEVVMQPGLPPMPFVSDLDETAICRRFPEMPHTELRDGIRNSLRTFAGS